VQALDAMKDATHAPGLGFRPQDRNGQRPEMFFANGGSPLEVEDEAKKVAVSPQPRRPRLRRCRSAEA
jgi:hypothetical protein